MTKKLDPETKARKARVKLLGIVPAERFSSKGKSSAHISFVLPDGQQVVGVFDHVGWNWPPAEELAKMREALSRGPVHMTGARVRSSRRPPPEKLPQS